MKKGDGDRDIRDRETGGKERGENRTWGGGSWNQGSWNHGPWNHGPRSWRHGPPWWEGRSHKRRFLFRRFAMGLSFILVFLIIGLVALLAIANHFGLDVFAHPVWIMAFVCGAPLAFLSLAAVFGGMAFRRFGSPVVDVMAAADAVAEGDFSVRVRDNMPGEFGRLANSFNRMTAELERTEQQRQNLTADVAHELRTPLHIIQGNLEGILDGVYEPTQEHITATLEETRLLARLVGDLQTLSLAEAGQLPLHLETIPAADLLSDVLTGFAGQAAEAGVQIEMRLPETGDALEIQVDSDRMEQVLSNLVANAMRHTSPGGKIILSAERLNGGEKESGVRLSVQDTGAGIAAEDLPYIFDRFWRGDRSRSHSGGAGSGLGLAIARQLVQAHGGKIDVQSRIEEGTTFRIDLYLQ